MRHLRNSLMALFALAIAVGPSLAQSPESLFVIVYHQGPAWDAKLPMGKQSAMGQHGAYMKRLFDEGASFAAGPTTDAPGGIVILHAASLEAAARLLAQDPSITSGMFVGEIHPWAPAYRSDKPLPMGN